MKRITIIFFCVTIFFQTAICQNRIGFIVGGIYAESNLKNQSQRVSEKLVWDNTILRWRLVNNSFKNDIIYAGKFSGFGGLVYDLKVTNAFSIKSKLLFVSKGWVEKNDYRLDTVFYLSEGNPLFLPYRNIPNEHTKSQQIYNFYYVELPINFTFYAPVRKSLLFIGIGPYISAALS
jgi:hypothetical protein